VRLPGVQQRTGDVLALLAGVGAGLAAGVAVASTRTVWGNPGGTATALGAIAAMVGTYLCLVLLVLISRLPVLEREVGHDRMVLWHRKVAPWALVLIVAHVVLTTIGYGQSSETSALAEFWSLITTYAWMMPALLAFVSMISLGVISWRPIRTRMSYETWWGAHLFFYVAIVLAIGHQLEFGSMFVDRPLVRFGWIAFYVTVAVVIAWSRVTIPVLRSWRHRLRVLDVVQETDGVTSVYVTGKDLAALQARGGQFFQWRFVTRHWWWQAHPYSLSMAPRGDLMRVTVKDLGDQSGSLALALRPGTRVLVEGPYGVFTAGARHGNLVTAFAAGVGITPIRAMLDDLPLGSAVTLLYRLGSMDAVPLRAELEALAAENGWQIWYLPGPRAYHPMTVNYVSRFVPELADSDVYVCGPEPFSQGVLAVARAAGVPESHLHYESFTF
jgi:predicted ferric reductase